MLSSYEIERLDTFIEWAKKNLPSFISIEDIATLKQKLAVNGMTVGAFVLSLNNIAGNVNVDGTIYTGVSSPFKYHEAFHAVFRSLLTDEEIKEYLKVAEKEVKAKYGKNFEEALDRFKNSAVQYQIMSRERLEQEFYEEYMADEFEKFKMNPKSTTTSSFIKSLFTRLLEWIKSVFKIYTKNELESLYENIDSAKYRSRAIQDNRFTKEIINGPATVAYKLIPKNIITLDSGKITYEYLDPKISETITAQIAALYIKREDEQKKPFKPADLLNETIADFLELYDPEADHNQSVEDIDGLIDVFNAMLEHSQFVKEGVIQQLAVFNSQADELEYNLEMFEEERGLRGVSDWDKDQASIGGFSSLAVGLRRYIGTTTIEETDMFGNSELRTGEKIIVPVNFADVYNGLLKAVKNNTNPVKMLQRMLFFSETNKQTRAVVNRVLQDIGITEEQVLEGRLPKSVKNPLFFTQIIKGFENFRVDYIFISRDPETNKVITYSAANRDDARSQIDRWSQEFDIKFIKRIRSKEQKRKALSVLRNLQDFIELKSTSGNKKDSITNKELKEKSIKLAGDIFETLGLKLSPGYIAYSVASAIEKPTKYQRALVESESGLYVIDPITVLEIYEHVDRDENIFLDGKKVGLKSRLTQMANGNAAFDETVGNSVFKNPNGDFVYAHQLPTYHLQKIEEFNNPDNLENMKKDSEYLVKNLLLNSPEFLQLSKNNKLRILRIAGSKTESINQNEDGLVESGGVNLTDSGKTYGDSTPVEFILNLINSYTYLFNTSSQTNATVEWKDPVTNEDKKTALAPLLIRVIEASNTGDMMALPIIKTVKKDKSGKTVLTDETLNLFVNEIETEFNRIKKESNEETRTEDLIEGYNAKNGARVDTGRAFEFSKDKTGILLTGKATTIKEQSRIKTPKMTDSTLENIFDGNQSILVRDEKVATTIGLSRTNSSGTVTLNKDNTDELFTITNRGYVEVTSENREDIIKELGKSVSRTKTDVYQIKVKIGVDEFYVESKDLKLFLEGKVKRYIFDIEKGVVETKQADQEIGINFKDILEKFAKNPDNSKATLMDALKESGYSENDFKDYLSKKLMSEYNVFKNELNNIKAENKISTLISNGFVNEAGVITDKAQIAMDQLNLIAEDKDYNLMQIYFNDWLNTTSINQILLGDQAIILKDAVDEIKRAKMQNASGYSAAMNITDEKSGILHPVKNISLFSYTEPKFNRKYSEGQGDKADAQMYITIKALRYFLFGFGKLTPAKVELLNKIERGDEISADEFFGNVDKKIKGYKEFDAIFNSEKLVYGDGKTFLKMSAVVLTKELTSNKDANGNWVAKPTRVELHNLRVKMENFEKEQLAKGKGTLAIAAPLSASKMLKKNIQSFADITNIDKSLTSDNETVLDAGFMRLQLINPSNKVIITDPTQLKNLITSEQDDNVEVIIDGKSFSLKDVRKNYNQSQDRRVKLKYINRRNLIFNFDIDIARDELHKTIKENAITANLRMFLRYATEGLKASQASTNILEYFSFDSSGNPKFDLNNPITINKFEQLFLAYFSKGILSESIPGHSAALMSDYGMKVYRRVFSVEKDENGNFVRDEDGNLIPDRFEIIREKNYENMENKPVVFDIVQLENEIPKEGIVVIDKLRGNLKEYDSKGKYTKQRYTEMLLPAHFKEIMELIENTDSKIPDVIAKAFGLRIPSQDKHSAVNIKLVDFLPVFYGSTAVFATDVVETSGADFDIDKAYMHIKEWYVNNKNEFVEYGKSKTEKEKYKDYVHYVNEKIKKSGSIYNEALELFESEGVNKTKSKTTKNHIKGYDAGFTDDSINALKVLGLPVTFEEYKKYKAKNGEPYEAPYNNELLDYKIALLGNQNITETLPQRSRPILYEPADLTPLTDEWDWIQKELPELAELANESGINIDNLFGKYKAFTNNKEGAASIGAVVLPNIYLNILKEYNVNIIQQRAKGETLPQIELNGHTFVNFGKNNDGTITGNYEIVNGIENKTGLRRQYVLSALITAMTDNAKERLAAKLGLNKDALGLVAVLTALGVPIRTSILLINNPIIRDNYFIANNKEKPTDPGIYKLLSDIKTNIEDKFGNDLGKVRVTDKLLIDAIKNKSFLLSPEGINNEEYDVTAASVDFAILTQFLNSHRLKSYLGNMSSLMNLNSGFGKSFTELADSDKAFAELGLGLNNKEFSELKYKNNFVPVDIRSLFDNNSKLWQATYYRIYNEFVNSLLPAAFLTRTETFRSIYNTVINNLIDNDMILTSERKDKISTDILSFITLKAYMKKLEGKSGITPLTNDIIYPQSEINASITDTIERLKVLYESENKSNYFLQYYLYNNKASNETNKSGLNSLSSNTYAQLNDSQKIRIQNGFMALYGDPYTRNDAMQILHYIMVKDGLQYGYNSILDSVTPYTLDSYLSNINTVHSIFKNRQNKQAFKNLFDMSFDDMVSYFTENYLQSNNNNYLLKTISVKNIYSETTNTALTTDKIDLTVVKNNPENNYVFGENKKELGFTGQAIIRGQKNAFPLTYKKGYQRTKDNYYTDNEVDEFLINLKTEIDNIKQNNQQVYFPNSLMTSEDKDNMKKFGPKIYQEFKNTLEEQFDYSLDGAVKVEKASISKKEAANSAVLLRKTNDKSMLIVDLYNQILPASKGEYKVNNLSTPKYLNKKQSDKLSSNFNAINYNFNIVKDEKANLNYVYFPLAIKVKGGEGQKNTFYKLEKVFSSDAVNSDTIITADKPVVRGQRAEYVEVKLKGSNQQNAIGFLFDTVNFTRPDYETVRQYVLSKDTVDLENNFVEPDSENYDPLDALDNVDFESRTNQKASLLTSGKNNIEANENEIKVNNVNIADAQETDTSEPDDNILPDESFENDFEYEDRKPVSISKLSFLKKPSGMTIESFWNSEIENNSENKAKLKENNILSLEDLIKTRNQGIYANDEAFIEQIKQCIL